MRRGMLVALALAVGCKEQRTAPAQARDAAAAAPATVDATPPPTPTIACETADDCGLSRYRSENDCCGDLCGYMTAQPNAVLKTMLARRDALCSRKDFTCKDADCPRIDYDQLPGCQAGACVVIVDVPHPTPCTADADCVLAPAARGECCGPKCGGPRIGALHENDAAALDAWRSSNCDLDACPSAKCVRPTFRTEARCVQGQCVADRIAL